MSNLISLTDLSAPELAPYTQLTHAQLRSRRDPQQGILIAESIHVISSALDAGCQPLSLLLEQRQLHTLPETFFHRLGDLPIYTAPREVLAQLTGYELTRGVLCAMRRPPLPEPEQLCRTARRLVVLEHITDSTNIGAIFRSAAALGMDAVLVTPSCCDPFYRRSLRVSMGAVFRIPWAWADGSFAPWPQPGLSRLKELGFQTAAMALDRRSISIEDPALTQAEKLAIILGSEGSGLSERTIADCDFVARIPMCHGVDSLNVAAAGAVVFWQLRPR